MNNIQQRAESIFDEARQRNKQFSVLLVYRDSTWWLEVYCHEGNTLVLLDAFKGDDAGPFYELTRKLEDCKQSRLVPISKEHHRKVSATFELL